MFQPQTHEITKNQPATTGQLINFRPRIHPIIIGSIYVNFTPKKGRKNLALR